MELHNIITIILLILSIILWVISYTTQVQCKPQVECKQQVQKKIPELDVQFGQNNYPSVIYSDLFTNANVFQGGYTFLNKTNTMIKK